MSASAIEVQLNNRNNTHKFTKVATYLKSQKYHIFAYEYDLYFYS